MSQLEINQVISQMRALSASMQRPAAAEAPAGQADFAALLREGIDKVSAQQETAQTMITGFQTGTGSASLPEVMVAMQKSSLSFTAMTQVRNRLVEAYQEIMNMPI